MLSDAKTITVIFQNNLVNRGLRITEDSSSALLYGGFIFRCGVT